MLSFSNYDAVVDGLPDAALVYRTGSGYTGTTPTWTDALYDPLGMFDGGVSPDRLTAQEAGLYRFIANWDNGGGGGTTVRTIALRDSGGAAISKGAGATRADISTLNSSIRSLAAGSYCVMTSDASLVWPVNNNTWLYAEKLPTATRICHVYNTGNVAVSSTEAVKGWDAEIQKDNGLLHDNVTNNSRITIDTGGPTLVRCSVAIETSAFTGKIFCRFRKNGAVIAGGGFREAGPSSGSVVKVLSSASAPIEVTVGDYLEVSIFAAASGNMVTGRSWFEVESIDASAYRNYQRVLVSKAGPQAISGSYANINFDAATYDNCTTGGWDVGAPDQIVVPNDVTFGRVSWEAYTSDSAGAVRGGPTGTGLAPSTSGNAFAQLNTSTNDRIGGFGPWVPVVPGSVITLQLETTGTHIAEANTSFGMEFFRP